jgi:hypothetical protein
VSKEELERVSVQGLSSSVPPRRASDAPATLPSTPPITDEIDTDWGADDSSDATPDWAADDSNEVTHVMQQPLRVVFTPPPPPEPDLPTAPAAPAAAQEATPELEAAPRVAPTPSDADVGRVVDMRPQAPTLIGLPAPTLPDSVENSDEPSSPEKRESAPPPMPSAAFSEPVRAPSVPPPPPPPAPIAAAPSSPPPPPAPIAAPSAPPPARSAPSVPPPSGSAASSTPSAPPPASPQPPAVAAPSTPPAARPSAPPARSSVPAPRALPTTTEVVATADASSPTSGGFGRWLLVLAAGLVVVCVLGYRVFSRERAAQAESTAANAIVQAATPAPTTATAEPAPAPSATEAANPESTTPPVAAASAASAASSASAETSDSNPSPATSASAAPATSARADAEKRRITVKSKPAKVRFYHFGKLVGVAPFVLEFKPGERHAYEAGLPGYGTRKVVIDGSKPEVLIGLTKEKP